MKINLAWFASRRFLQRVIFSAALLSLNACSTLEETVYLLPETGIWLKTEGWSPHQYYYNCDKYKVMAWPVHVYSGEMKTGPIYPALKGRPGIDNREKQLRLKIAISGNIADAQKEFELFSISVIYQGRELSSIENSEEFFSDQNYFRGVYTFPLTLGEIDRFEVIFNKIPMRCEIPRLSFQRVNDADYSLIHMGI